MNDYLTAKEAGEISEENNKNLIKVLDRIKEMAELGYNRLDFEKINLYTYHKLNELGYSVMIYEDKTKVYLNVVIEW